MASPWDRVEEAEEEVEEPCTVRLIQESGLCRFGLTRGGGATTEDCLDPDVSSSEPDEESEQQRTKYDLSSFGPSWLKSNLGLSPFLFYLVECGFQWETAHRWSVAWWAWEVPSSLLYVLPGQLAPPQCGYLKQQKNISIGVRDDVHN